MAVSGVIKVINLFVYFTSVVSCYLAMSLIIWNIMKHRPQLLMIPLIEEYKCKSSDQQISLSSLTNRNKVSSINTIKKYNKKRNEI